MQRWSTKINTRSVLCPCFFSVFRNLWVKNNKGIWHYILWPKMSSWDPDLTLPQLVLSLTGLIHSDMEVKVVTSSLYSHGTGLCQSNPTGNHWLKLFAVFVIFLCQMMRQYINAGCDHFLSYWFHLSHLLSFHALYSLCLIYLALASVISVILCSIQMNMFIVIT